MCILCGQKKKREGILLKIINWWKNLKLQDKISLVTLPAVYLTLGVLCNQTNNLRSQTGILSRQVEVMNKNLISDINDSFIRNRPFVLVEVSDVYRYTYNQQDNNKKVHMAVHFKNVGDSPATIKGIKWENYAGNSKRPSLQEWMELQNGKLAIHTIFPQQSVDLTYKPDVGVSEKEAFKLSVRIEYDGIDDTGYWYSYDVTYSFLKQSEAGIYLAIIDSVETNWDQKGEKL